MTLLSVLVAASAFAFDGDDFVAEADAFFAELALLLLAVAAAAEAEALADVEMAMLLAPTGSPFEVTTACVAKATSFEYAVGAANLTDLVPAIHSA